MIPAEIRDFYQSRSGQAALNLLRGHVEKLWPVLENERILTLGAAELLFPGLPVSSARMTGAEGETFSCFVDSKNKPLPDASVDRIAVLHGGDFFDLAPVVREGRRVLKGEGRMLLILPRKGSSWAMDTTTPFGRDPAYSQQELKNILKSKDYFVGRVERTLFAPPGEALWTRAVERMASFVFFFGGGGVLIVDAQKRELGLVSVTSAREGAAESFAAMPMPCG